MEARIVMIFLTPSIFKCSLLLTIFIAKEKSLKFICFCVNRGYFEKCGILISLISLIDYTEYITDFLFLFSFLLILIIKLDSPSQKPVIQ